MSDIPAINSRALSASLARDLPKYFTKQEVHAILYSYPEDYASMSNEARLKLYAKRFLAYFLWQTGARIEEAHRVQLRDIEPYAGVIHIESLKKKKNKSTRSLPKDLIFFMEINAYCQAMGISDRDSLLFPYGYSTIRRWITDLCLAGGVDRGRAHPHTFRHSFAINCVLNKAPIRVIQKWLGHSDIMKTLIYTDIVSADTRQFMHGMEF